MSVASAQALGLDGIEMDVQLSADNVLVAYHPEDLRELTACTGKINARTWEEIQTCPIATDKATCPIVRVDKLMRYRGARAGGDLTFDCKLFTDGDWWAYLHAFADALVHLDQQPGMQGRFVVECQVTDFLDLIESKRPAIDTYLYATEFAGAIDSALVHGCTGITIDNALITAKQVNEAQDRGLRVTLFGVDGALAHHDALAKHPDRLQTDSPEDFAR